MSLLPATSHANPDTPFWERDLAVTVVEAGGNGVIQNFVGTSPFTVITKNFTAPANGLLVINSAINFTNTASTSGSYTARIVDTIGGGFTLHTISLPAGNVTSQSQSACPMLSTLLTKGQSVTLQLNLSASNGAGSPSPTYKWDWNALFYIT